MGTSAGSCSCCCCRRLGLLSRASISGAALNSTSMSALRRLGDALGSDVGGGSRWPWVLAVGRAGVQGTSSPWTAAGSPLGGLTGDSGGGGVPRWNSGDLGAGAPPTAAKAAWWSRRRRRGEGSSRRWRRDAGESALREVSVSSSSSRSAAQRSSSPVSSSPVEEGGGGNSDQS